MKLNLTEKKVNVITFAAVNVVDANWTSRPVSGP